LKSSVISGTFGSEEFVVIIILPPPKKRDEEEEEAGSDISKLVDTNESRDSDVHN
jgi:hypothetical protein